MTKKYLVSLGTISKLQMSRAASVMLTYVKDFIPEYSYITFDALHYCIVIVW